MSRSGHTRNDSESSVAFWDQIDEEAKRERMLQKERERELREREIRERERERAIERAYGDRFDDYI
ncbi:hypothetical protein HK097_008313 [Rhizophlyctis rosea]|uniref:Uncharacterized protein n=1 Tax=Rhizophlyctis rosea TaxID=64517 RepID=A0AAD5X144_9FUNG|nr:hypothetical protein HK097_008313 [Rhizophlyctis rosea]